MKMWNRKKKRTKSLSEPVSSICDERRDIIAQLLDKEKSEITDEFLERALNRESIISLWEGPRAKNKTVEEAIEDFRKFTISK